MSVVVDTKPFLGTLHCNSGKSFYFLSALDAFLFLILFFFFYINLPLLYNSNSIFYSVKAYVCPMEASSLKLI